MVNRKKTVPGVCRACRVLAVVLWAAFWAFPLWGMDLEISGGLGNTAFDTERESALGLGGEAFKGRLFPEVLVKFSGEAENGVYYNGGFEREPLLRTQVFAAMGIRLDHIYLEIGPFMGLFNAQDQAVNPGLSAGMGLELPGVVFVNLRASSSLGSILNDTGEYLQRSAEISAGFWIPYVICSFNINTKDFALAEKGNLHIEDSLSRYFFRADVFSKNVPYTCRLDLGYQNLSRSYSSYRISGANLNRDIQTDEFKALYMGLEFSHTVTPAFKLILGGEMPVYAWSVRPMKNQDRGSLLFKAYAGVILTLGANWG
jgi:hypothetical protein